MLLYRQRVLAQTVTDPKTTQRTRRIHNLLRSATRSISRNNQNHKTVTSTWQFTQHTTEERFGFHLFPA
jgi:hypothetical protein